MKRQQVAHVHVPVWVQLVDYAGLARAALLVRGDVRNDPARQTPQLVSILATRVELISPRRDRASLVICWRCGIEFDHQYQNVTPDAPCRDCRAILRAEGDKTVWRRQKKETT